MCFFLYCFVLFLDTNSIPIYPLPRITFLFIDPNLSTITMGASNWQSLFMYKKRCWSQALVDGKKCLLMFQEQGLCLRLHLTQALESPTQVNSYKLQQRRVFIYQDSLLSLSPRIKERTSLVKKIKLSFSHRRYLMLAAFRISADMAI